MSRKYKFHNESAVYFISFATVYWLDIFTRQVYFNVLEESIEYGMTKWDIKLWILTESIMMDC
ncbi:MULTISPECIES: hypothetical protein [Tenacibaculum]|uniref:hypothetical protein n=1 Tax=Tenacibaculum TaxID=104267 RepID=UPI0009E1D876|nr:hypothetical protein [Tenacibaculum mesophilum]KAF9660123.1 hypothetical protein HBA12_07775 [Tenacibaculum mesophilum]